MNIAKPFKSIQNFLAPSKNSMGSDLGKQFLKYGNNRPLVQDWSKVVMSDKDLYTGYSYSAINNRANKSAQLASENIRTFANDSLMKSSKQKGVIIQHPYLEIIDQSKTFSNYRFWYDISTFLDLEGVYYLLAVRTVEGERVGRVQEFKMINPYNVRRIRNQTTGEIGGYVEARDGMVREIPPQMIIDIRNLNPFSSDDSYAMTDAFKEFQYTLKQAGDYTRHSLKNNMAAPGIISTDMLLEDEQFHNFVNRVTNQEKGLPLFGNGAGAISWDSMQIDLDKAGLDKINEINRSTVMAVSGVGKTMMSIEESGTTRETAKVQKDLFIESHIMPQLQLILDALNQDYKRYYEADYIKNGYTMFIENPLGTDKDAELKDIQIRTDSMDLYNSLVDKGYSPELSAKYTQGEITLDELGQPTVKPKQTTPTSQKPQKEEEDLTSQNARNKAVRVANQFEEEMSGLLATQQSALQNEVVRIETDVVTSVTNKLLKNQNAFEETTDIMTKKEQAQHEKELETSLNLFYLALIPIYASMVLSSRTKEFGMSGDFSMTPAIKRETKQLAKKISQSHIETILEDLRGTIQETYNANIQAQLSAIEATGRKVTDSDLVLARKRALEGNGQAKIVSEIKNEYKDITTTRAKAISRTESARAFNTSQFQADKQFIEQNGLEGKAYKKWVTMNDKPCPTCIELSNMPPVPFNENFANIGDTIESTYTTEAGKTKTFKTLINFTDLGSGNAHVNCGCRYRLIIE